MRHKVVVVAVTDRYIEAETWKEAALIAVGRVETAMVTAGMMNAEVAQVIRGSYLDRAIEQLRCVECYES